MTLCTFSCLDFCYHFATFKRIQKLLFLSHSDGSENFLIFDLVDELSNFNFKYKQLTTFANQWKNFLQIQTELIDF